MIIPIIINLCLSMCRSCPILYPVMKPNGRRVRLRPWPKPQGNTAPGRAKESCGKVEQIGNGKEAGVKLKQSGNATAAPAKLEQSGIENEAHGKLERSHLGKEAGGKLEQSGSTKEACGKLEQIGCGKEAGGNLEGSAKDAGRKLAGSRDLKDAGKKPEGSAKDAILGRKGGPATATVLSEDLHGDLELHTLTMAASPVREDPIAPALGLSFRGTAVALGETQAANPEPTPSVNNFPALKLLVARFTVLCVCGLTLSALLLMRPSGLTWLPVRKLRPVSLSLSRLYMRLHTWIHIAYTWTFP